MSIDIPAEIKFSHVAGTEYLVKLRDAEQTTIGYVRKLSGGWSAFDLDRAPHGSNSSVRLTAAAHLLATYELANGLRDSEGRRVAKDVETRLWCVVDFRGVRESARWTDKADAVAHLASLQPTEETKSDPLGELSARWAARVDAQVELENAEGEVEDLVPDQHTITDRDIRERVVEPLLGRFAADYDIDAIMTDLFARWPLSEWTYADLKYDHADFNGDAFAEIIQRHDLSVDVRLAADQAIDTQRCVDNGEHLRSSRHTAAECPVQAEEVDDLESKARRMLAESDDRLAVLESKARKTGTDRQDIMRESIRNSTLRELLG